MKSYTLYSGICSYEGHVKENANSMYEVEVVFTLFKYRHVNSVGRLNEGNELNR